MKLLIIEDEIDMINALVKGFRKKGYIVISDTGIGISEEQLKYIFEPFYRVDKSRSRKIGGSGLGLAIAYDIILKHQGTIEYSAAEQKGSIFKIMLPIEQVI